MATQEHREYPLGVDWIIPFACTDGAGAALDLTGGDVQFRLASEDALLVDLSGGAGVSLDADPTTGLAVILVAVADQAALAAAVYRFEVRAVLSDGTIVDQAFGSIHAARSLFVEFP